MSSHDPAFLWETEALRQRRGERNDTRTDTQPGWVTLRAAHDATGVPIDTLRKWGRRGTVPSTVAEADGSRRRLVLLDSVVALAREQGRPPGAAGAAPAQAPAAQAATEASPTPGTMIVPIEAWDKMLIQLGNLHEAGQQLAEARERAAKAETEATFLRERLAELRGAPGTHASPPPAIEDDASHEDPGPTEGEPGAPVVWWLSARRRWRSRKRR